MSTYTTNTKPESKFEDVPEEVLTDPNNENSTWNGSYPRDEYSGG